MTEQLYTISTDNINPYHNLALEEYLLNTVQPGQCILYLWQNQRTVVIGRNQNAENECHVSTLEADGGHLARRLSGGGAVYHDLGNLNFTFLVPTEDFDVKKQTEVILRAVQSAGIRAERTGRNDLTADGKKFSGHAYYHTGTKSYHHGTLMVNVDKEPLNRYLNVSSLKLRAKGVSSVRSRVGNLIDWNPELTIDMLKKALLSAFGEVYGLPVRSKQEEEIDWAEVEKRRKRFDSPEWKYGSSGPMQYSRENRFDWGTVRIDFSVSGDCISEAVLWSDGLEADYLSSVSRRLKQAPLQLDALQNALSEGAPDMVQMAEDIAALIMGTEGIQ